jgi:hypothetical protein
MNTVISSACSLSTVFHKAHHNAELASHHHHSEKTVPHHSTEKHNHSGSKESSSKEDCCSKSVIQFEKLDKVPAKTVVLSSAAFVLMMGALTDFIPAVLIPSITSERIFIDYVRWRPPATIQDLRIVMQSFQI